MLLAFRGLEPGMLKILKIVLLVRLTVSPLRHSQKLGQEHPFPEQIFKKTAEDKN